MNWNEFSNHLSKELNQEIHIEQAQSVAGGDIHQAYTLNSSQGQFFLKANQASSLPLFATEAHSLKAIHNSHTIACPEALGYGTFKNQAWLLLQHMHLTSQGDDYQRGCALAKMHQTVNDRAQPFGWFEDNFIGHTLQKNQWHFNWVDFYAQQRLLPQLELSQIKGASRQIYQLGIELIEALPFWFQTYQPQASLLHGDLWGGNSAFVQQDNTTQPVLFDPASYYGDRETDLAMTELFGGFSRDFYAGYQATYPLDKGYSARKPLYNLYHILNHFNLFGGHYQSQALQMIQALLQQARSSTI